MQFNVPACGLYFMSAYVIQSLFRLLTRVTAAPVIKRNFVNQFIGGACEGYARESNVGHS